jgi:DNA helicase-2/ATP-dependent DNA helicase PcrA
MVAAFRRQSETAGLVERVSAVVDELENAAVDWDQHARTGRSVAEQPEFKEASAKLRSCLRQLEGRDLIDLYRSLWESRDILAQVQSGDSGPPVITGAADFTLGALHRRFIPYEDVLPLLLLNGLFRGFPPIRNLDHAIIDEAQDYSYLDFEYIKRCLPGQCRLTIVGDINQTLSPALSIHDDQVLERVFRSRVTRLNLSRSYRSTAEIIEFARRILGDGVRIESVRRTGTKPRLLPLPENDTGADVLADAVRSLLRADRKSIAVICRTRAEAQLVYGALSSRVRVSLLTGESSGFSQGVFVVPVHLAKGLEFDAVIVADAGSAAYGQVADRKLLYTACTRALHELYVFYTGKPSPLLPLGMEELYARTC